MLDLLLPTRCALCGRTGAALCARCVRTLPPAPRLSPPPGFRECESLLAYDGATKELVAALKFRGHLDAVGLLGAAMADLVGPTAASVVTWAPTTARRRRRRGFDQAELLAGAVAAALGLPCRRLLRRASDANQTGRGRAERLDGPEFRGAGSVSGVVLVVDDVRTTGSTLSAAGDALVGAGATAVVGLTLAVTP